MNLFFIEILRLEWVRTILIAATSAVAAYGWKTWIEGRERERKARASTIGQLQDLKSLLDTSDKLFRIQRDQVNRLKNRLKETHPAEYAWGVGSEDKMQHCYPQFNDEEKALHGVIRAYTVYSMRRVNEAIQKWLERDKQFKTGQVNTSRREELAATLRELEMHLLLWHAKYEYWIPNQPNHALVYMADEKAHGLGFPRDRVMEVNGIKTKLRGVDAEVAGVLEELRGKWK